MMTIKEAITLIESSGVKTSFCITANCWRHYYSDDTSRKAIIFSICFVHKEINNKKCTSFEGENLDSLVDLAFSWAVDFGKDAVTVEEQLEVCNILPENEK